ncbi:MAG: hypothetical protein AAF990_13430 [Bacteroidota bacterium]
MNISIELSLYPLKESYETPILDFIERLQAYPEIRVRPNVMSTQVFGSYDDVMRIVTLEMKKTFDQPDTFVMVFKAVNAQLDEI